MKWLIASIIFVSVVTSVTLFSTEGKVRDRTNSFLFGGSGGIIDFLYNSDKKLLYLNPAIPSLGIGSNATSSIGVLDIVGSVNVGGGEFHVSSTDATTLRLSASGTSQFANTLTFNGATTSSFAVSGIASGSCVQTVAGGAFVGTGSACGSGSPIAGQNGTWESIYGNTLRPTSTANGIQVTGSSTVELLRVGGSLNASTTNVDTLTVYTGSTFPANDIVDAEVSNTLTASQFGTNPANCSAGNYPLGIDEFGVVESCTADVDTNTVGQNGAWQALWLNTLSPTNTLAGIYISAASSTITVLRTEMLNATTSNVDTLVVNTGSTFPANDITDAEVSNTLTASTLAADGANCSAGNYPLGVDAMGAVQDCTADVDTDTNTTGQNGAWFAIWANSLAPTNTAAGIYVPAASSTLAGLRLTGSLDINNQNITNHYGTACSGNQWLQDIADGGAFTCTNLDVTGDWTGTLDGDNASAFARAGVNGIWQALWANTLSPTNTAAGIFVNASSTIAGDFRVDGNSTTTGRLVIGTTQPTGNFAAGNLWVQNGATSSSLGVSGLTAADCDVKSTTAGSLYCGTDANSGGGGGNGAWQALWANTLSPTNTAAGIFVNASSTVAANFRVDGNATTTKTFAVGSSADGWFSIERAGLSGVTYNFQQGVSPDGSYAGAEDLNLESGTPTTNQDADTTIQVDGASCAGGGGTCRALMQWDISSITSCTVTSASVTINVTNATASKYAVFSVRRNWGETTATWNTYDGSNGWTTAGVGDTTDDRFSTDLMNGNADSGWGRNSTGSHTLDFDSDGIAEIQNWINGSVTNNGIVIYDEAGDTDGYAWDDKTNATSGNRPKLTIVCAPSADTLVSNSSNDLYLLVASSTVRGNWRVEGNTTTTGTSVIGSSQPVGNVNAGDLYVGGDATTTGSVNIAGSLGLNSEYWSDLSSAALSNVAGVLTLVTSGDWTGTLDGSEGGSLANNPGAWQALWLNTLSPTNTAAGIYISAASSTIATLRTDAHNATTSNVGTLTVYAGSTFPADDITDAEVSNTLTASTFANNPANCSPGNYPLGIDATGAVEDCTADVSGGGGGNGAWQALWANTLSPTNTTAGIFVNASSTIAGNFRVDGNATTTGAMRVGRFNLNGEDVTSLLGSGLLNTAGVLTLDRTGAWTGTFDGDEGTAFARAGVNGIWQTLWANTLAPTNTSAGIFSYASSTINGTLRVGNQVTISKPGTSNQQTVLTVMQDSASTDQNGSMTADVDFHLWDNNTRLTTPQARIGVVGSGVANQDNESGGRLTFWTNIENFAAPVLTERMRIDPNGNVGINTTNPFYKLHVVGTATSTFHVSGNSRLDGGVTTTGRFVTGSTNPSGNVNAGDAFIGGSVSTTNSISIGVSSDTDDDNLYFDQGLQFIGWDESAGEFDVSNDLSVNGPVLTVSGTESAPGHSFSGDPNTGVFEVGVDNLGITTGGTTRWHIDQNDMVFTVPSQGADGSSALPTYSFDNDPDSGMYFSSSGGNAITIGVDSEALLIIDTTNINFGEVAQGILGTVAIPTFGFTADPDTGMFRYDTNVLGLTAGGVHAMLLGNGTTTIPTNLKVDGNATTSGYLVIGTSNPVAPNMAAGDLRIGGNVTTTGTRISFAGGAVDQQINFDGCTTATNCESFIWDDAGAFGAGNFQLTDDLTVDGILSSSGEIVTGNATVTGHLSLDGLTTTGSAAAAYVCLNTAGEAVEDSTACLPSARKYKNTIGLLDIPALDIISALEPVTFLYNDEIVRDDHNLRAQQIGLIADDVQYIDPRLISTEPDGNPRSIKYDAVTAVLIKAVQEQQQQIDELKRQLQGLSTNACAYEFNR